MAFFRSRGVRIALVLLVVSFVAASAGAGALYYLLIRDLPDFEQVEDYRPPVTSFVYDRKGRPIAEFYTEQRRLVPIEEIPRHVKMAFVSAEDGKFYEHEGFDFIAILRAALANLREGGIAQGASTITQQTVKSLLLSSERTYERKLREILLARRLEQALSKDEILYLYLNQIYFGNGAHGIGQAAWSYFGKQARDLTVSEAALLAGLPQRPSAYEPTRNPAAAEARRRYVLGRMLAEGHIDQATHDRELAAPPVLADHRAEREAFAIAGYFGEEVRRLLYKELGQDVVLGAGLRIETTLDLELQRTARDAVQRGLIAQDHRHGYRGPLRRIEASERQSELVRLALANAGLEQSAPGRQTADDARAADDEEAAAGSSAPLESAPRLDESQREQAAAEIRRRLAAGEPLEGLVLALDRESQHAKVGFGAGVEGRAAIADVKWARKPNPRSAPYSLSEIQSVFAVGDVVRFVELGGSPQPAGEAGDGSGGVALAAQPARATKNLARLDIWQEPFAQGALLSFDNATGDVLAMIGGFDFAKSEFNRAVQAQRLPGSAFKPFIYGAALSRGYTPVSTVIDRPVVYTDPSSGFVWAPRNYGRKSYGPMTMRDALKKSINNATVYLFRDLGPSYVIEHARRFGIQSKLTPDLSLALGTSAVTLLELTRAYAVYPRGGVRMVPRFITRVVDRDGKMLLEQVPLGDEPPPLAPLPVPEVTTTASGDASWSNTRDPGNQVISPADAYLMCDMLQAVVREGTGAGLAKLGRTFAGKTGTTNEYSDAWFMGFSPEITTGVWVGNDDNLVLGRGETGGTTALPIWGDFMKVAVAPYPDHDFEAPADIEFRRVDKTSGLLADASTQDAYFQPFRAGTAPERTFTEQTVEKKTRQAARDDTF